MKLRKIEPNQYEYPWENPGTIKCAVVFDKKWVIAVFDSMYWAQHFKLSISMPSGDRMEIFEVVE